MLHQDPASPMYGMQAGKVLPNEVAANAVIMYFWFDRWQSAGRINLTEPALSRVPRHFDGLNGDQLAQDHPSLATYLSRAVTWFADGLQQNLKQRGLATTTRTQSQVLGSLALGEVRPSRLARSAGISPQAMTAVLSEMADAGWIELFQDEGDGRARVVRLIAGGLEHQAQVRNILTEMEAVLEQRFGRPIIDVIRMVVEDDWGRPPIFVPVSGVQTNLPRKLAKRDEHPVTAATKKSKNKKAARGR